MVEERPSSPEHNPNEGAPAAPEVSATPQQGLPAPAPYQPLPVYARGRPIPIRDMRVGELLDASIKIYRIYWKTFLAIAAYILVPLTFLQSFLSRSELGSLQSIFSGEDPGSADTTAIVSSVLFGLISFFFVFPFLTAAFAKVTADLYLGTEPTVSDTYRFALGKTRSILLVSVLTGLAVFGGFILLIVPAFIFYVRFTFSSVAVVVENLRGREAMGRSWRLAKGFFWKTFGTIALAGLLANIVGGLLSLPLNFVAQALGPAAWPIDALGSTLGQVITRPFATIVVVLLYFDLRIRKEGLDLALMVEDMSPTGL